MWCQFFGPCNRRHVFLFLVNLMSLECAFSFNLESPTVASHPGILLKERNGSLGKRDKESFPSEPTMVTFRSLSQEEKAYYPMGLSVHVVHVHVARHGGTSLGVHPQLDP